MMSDSGKGLFGVILTGVILTSAVYLVLNNAKAFGTISQGVAGTFASLGNTARGQ